MPEMLRYVNPIALLNLSPNEIIGDDTLLIRKAKRVLLAEIELSDVKTIFHDGVELNVSDCLRVIDELDFKDKKDFHLFIFENKELHNFLSYGDLSFFRVFREESLYKQKQFLDFISPYFAFQYAGALSKNFREKNTTIIRSILSVRPIVSESFIDTCYRPTYNLLKELNDEVIKITQSIKFDEQGYDGNDYSDLVRSITELINVELVNLLPSYFQSLRNQCAQLLRDLARDLNNEPYRKYKPAFEICEMAYAISTDGLVHQKIKKDYYVIKNNYDQVKLVNSNFKKPEKEDKPKSEVRPKENSVSDTISPHDERSYLIYSVLLIVILGIAFFYLPVQKIILAIILFKLTIPIVVLVKDREFSLGTWLKIQGLYYFFALGGLFYPVMGQLLISYNFFLNISMLLYLKGVFGDSKSLKKDIGLYVIGAIAATSLYNALTYQEVAKTKTLKSVELKVENLTDREYFKRGSSFFRQGNYIDAVLEFDKAIAANPKYMEAYFDRGASKLSLGKYEEAISDLNKAAEMGNNTSLLHSNLGYAFAKLSRLDTALFYFNRAIELDPHNDHAYRGRGDLKYDKNDIAGAVIDYTKAISYLPIASNYFARGLAYYYLNLNEKALSDINKAIELNPNVAQYYYDRGDVKDKMNDLDGACKDWSVAKEKGYEVPNYKMEMCESSIVNVPNSEFIDCVGMKFRYNRELNNKLVISVGSQASVAVKLINITSNKCIRYVFVNKNSTFSIRNIPEGKYFLKIAYGDDWSVQKGKSLCTGRFARNQFFEKGSDVLDYNLIYSDNGYTVPSFSLKLDLVIMGEHGNKFATNRIKENAFYNE